MTSSPQPPEPAYCRNPQFSHARVTAPLGPYFPLGAVPAGPELAGGVREPRRRSGSPPSSPPTRYHHEVAVTLAASHAWDERKGPGRCITRPPPPSSQEASEHTELQTESRGADSGLFVRRPPSFSASPPSRLRASSRACETGRTCVSRMSCAMFQIGGEWIHVRSSRDVRHQGTPTSISPHAASVTAESHHIKKKSWRERSQNTYHTHKGNTNQTLLLCQTQTQKGYRKTQTPTRNNGNISRRKQVNK